MVDYKTRIFFEPDSDSVGAEVKIYSSDNENIDKIVITTDSVYNELIKRVDELDSTFVSQDDLLEILTNVSQDIVINASTLGGLSSDNFAKTNHNELHEGHFAPIDHATGSNRYGLADSNNYGHVKTIDHLNTQTNLNGEALSAYQGKVLQGNIDTLNALLTPSFKSIPHTGMAKESNGNYRFTDTSKIRLTKMGKLVICDILIRANRTFGTANSEYQVVKLPSGYQPKTEVIQDWCHYQHDLHGYVVVQTDGNIKITTNTKDSTPAVHMNLVWVTQ